MRKVHGFIVTDEERRLVTDAYGSVLLFRAKEDAAPYTPIGGKLHRVVTARIGRRSKPRSQPVK